jgi:hypothetical protein
VAKQRRGRKGQPPHPKDVARRQGKNVKPRADKLARNPKYSNKFDSTAGYPGEGPAGPPGTKLKAHKGRKGDRVARVSGASAPRRRKNPGAQKCYNCHKPGHFANECKAPKSKPSLATDEATAESSKVVLNSLVGQSSAAAAAAADPAQDHKAGEEHEDNVNNLGSAEPSPAPDPKHGVEEKPPLTDDDKARILYDNLFSKASLAYSTTKDPDSVVDRHVVSAQLTAIARQATAHTLPIDGSVAQLCADAHNAAITEALDVRASFERSRVFGRRYTWADSFALGVAGVSPNSTADSVALPPMDSIKLMEPYKTKSKGSYWHLAWWQGRFYGRVRWLLWIVLFALLEETFKHALSFMFTTGELDSYQLPTEVFCTWFLASLLISVHEMKSTSLRGRLMEVPTRVFAHVALLHLGLFTAAIVHVMWNLACPLEWQLNTGHSLLARSRSTTAHPSRTTPSSFTDTCGREAGIEAKPTHSDFKCDWGEAECTPRFGGRTFWGLRDVKPTVYRSCSCNFHIGLCGRVGKALPVHEDASVMASATKRWKSISNELEYLFADVPRILQPVPLQEWISSFPPRKQAIFQRILHVQDDFPQPTVGAFIKLEFKNILIDEDAREQHGDARIIQAPPPAYAMRCGPYLRKLAKEVREHFRPVHGQMQHGKQITYVCGLTAEQVGEEFANAIRTVEATMEPGDRVVVVEDDQSRFDLHMLEGAFKFLSKFYGRRLPRKVVRALRRTKRSRGRGKQGQRYSVPFGMQSGFPDTSVGDSLCNILMKLSVHVPGRNWLSIINGDDSVTVTTEFELERLGGINAIKARYVALGMETKVFVRDNPLAAEFCSSRFHPCGDTFVLMPFVGKILARMCTDKVNRNAAGQQAWLRGVSATLTNFGRIDPLCRALSNAIVRETGEGRVIPQDINLYKAQITGTVTPSELDTAVFYDLHYGFSEAMISACVAELSSAGIGQESTHGYLNHLARIDAGGA